jgi:microcystin-dependent protein
MPDPFLSEIKIMSFNYAPRGWAQCNGQLLPINQNQALFSLLGTTYGGNGQTTFALPDLRGRVPIHVGGGHTLGERAGEESHTLTLAELPTHLHALMASNTTGDAPVPFSNGQGNVLASNPSALYKPPANLVAMEASSVTNVGGSQPHLNLQPFLTLNYCICLVGIFPSQN